MEDKDNKTVVITFRTTDKMKEDLELIASNDRRSLGDFIRLQLEEIIKKFKKK